MTTLLRTLVAAFVLIASASAAPAPRPPNVVVIFCDDLGYADIGPFGCKSYTTPHLDRMAKEGRKFTNFHVSQAVCSASRTALLTGCYNNRVGIHGALGPGSRIGIHANEMTMAEVFKQKGYATGMAGKWHLGHHPQFLPVRHGFDEYLGLPYSNDMWPHHPEAKKGSYPNLPLIEGDKVIDPDITPEKQPNLTTWYAERAVKFIERNKDRPFFFYLAHNMPHVPLHVSSKFAGRSGAGLYGDVVASGERHTPGQGHRQESLRVTAGAPSSDRLVTIRISDVVEQAVVRTGEVVLRVPFRRMNEALQRANRLGQVTSIQVS